ncbi:recombination protein RecR [Candidatus Desantisbacteria bacterium CG_4_10_14_0_8_um_filter_48_22]|uniref:Recombination protein RecR n=1 Tax=Candidatus Desantisbacteria bacterium CG_4_10_14_0_8_um_filter_48_22 TaxID=1974543 RepID=A0A2M7SFJ7_9BACT|nr:MAG: recombination protein RecR [Candidatus Desantisbacteria bacterium CG1_02_49_89]PIV56596.1 MAG: recombination protein RecR [Candidatus Desantisbacteria bacterium CG02_land_8_20_14_3_00_49_13]PIZ18315.1 MAG: recombination protein RecR [Candidatus Desantisbacteria bacterium CG_4_10_14_0_8_um_filter_48_22]
MIYSKILQKLIEQLNKLPGIGPKTAQRLAIHILNSPGEDARELSAAIKEAKEKIKNCSVCFNLTEEDPCFICRDPGRDRSIICVVEQPSDLMAFEKIRQYKGLYHILGGAISPLEGINPEDLRIEALLSRLKDGIKEVVIATNPNAAGEATALFIAKLIKPSGIKVMRIAHGLPVGGDLEFADEITLLKSLEGRREM